MIGEVMASGTEIVRGRSQDTNSVWIARRLQALGCDVRFFSCYADDLRELTEGIRLALRRAGVVLLTGGLGPTVDDFTRDAAARAFGRKLVRIPGELERIRARFRALGRDMPKINERQAWFPQGSEVIPNPVGSAAGFLLERGPRVFIALPGVPREMTAMLPDALRRIRRLTGEAPWADKAFKIVGIPESVVETALYPFIRRRRNLEYGITAKSGVISVNLRARGPSPEAELDLVRSYVRRKLKSAFFGEDDETIAQATARLLLLRGRTISVAESFTGGEIASRLTDVPGISSSLIESVVAYHDRSKILRLGVSPETIRRRGAVSAETAREMAEGSRKRARTDLAVATTGIAGPTGATPEKPVGLAYLALASSRGTRVERRIFSGGRGEIKDRASDIALDMIRQALVHER